VCYATTIGLCAAKGDDAFNILPAGRFYTNNRNVLDGLLYLYIARFARKLIDQALTD
jgi:hypothetical protein